MNSYTRLVSFDFDATLIHTPNFEDGKDIWEKATGMKWPGRGWWGNRESLNTEIFYFPVNEWVYRKYLEVIDSPDNYVFLATGRLDRLRDSVLKILSTHDIVFDDVFCNTGGETLNFKKRLFEGIIKDNPKAEEFVMYDDRHDHLSQFVEWGKLQPIKVTIFDVKNKKQIL